MNNMFSINRPNQNLLNILNIISHPILINNPINDILNRSFNDQGGSTHPTDEKVVENLEQIEFTEDQELSCGICLENFKKGDKALLLPCKENKHYFHLGEDEESCCGILPWLKENNTCPICREVFPEKKVVEENVEEENNDETDDIIDNESDDNIDTVLDDVERFLESIIQTENSDEEEYSEVLTEEEGINNNISEFLDGINEYMHDEEEESDDDRVNETAENIANLITNSIMNDFNRRRNIINRGPFINIVMNPPRQVYDEEHELQLAIQRSMEER